jgi:hypothetical protein
MHHFLVALLYSRRQRMKHEFETKKLGYDKPIKECCKCGYISGQIPRRNCKGAIWK